MDAESALRDRWMAIEERLRAACARSGRQRSEVTLVAVTKTVDTETAQMLPRLGILDLGENRPQELWHKAAALPSTVHWHLIGHLQRNKLEKTVPLTHLIHSVDSVRLLQALDQVGERRAAPIHVLLEVNASRESSKQGFAIEEVPSLVEKLARCRSVHIQGLMTMAAYEDDPERCRPTFAALRTLRDQLHNELPAPHKMVHLSMGMSNDFEVAVEEGATHVRIGTALFRDD